MNRTPHIRSGAGSTPAPDPFDVNVRRHARAAREAHRARDFREYNQRLRAIMDLLSEENSQARGNVVERR